MGAGGGPRSPSGWGQGDHLEARFAQRPDHDGGRGNAGEGNHQGPAHGDPDRLAVEGIAGSRIEQDRPAPKAAALRKMPPTLSWLASPTSPTTRVPAAALRAVPRPKAQGARRATARMPRWMGKPTMASMTEREAE